MPFKPHSKGRRYIPRQHHRVTNWREYDASLRNRGSLTIWFTPEAIAGWKAQPRTTPVSHCTLSGSDSISVQGHGPDTP
jgi:hypothetical protein